MTTRKGEGKVPLTDEEKLIRRRGWQKKYRDKNPQARSQSAIASRSRTPEAQAAYLNRQKEYMRKYRAAGKYKDTRPTAHVLAFCPKCKLKLCVLICIGRRFAPFECDCGCYFNVRLTKEGKPLEE